MTEYQKAINTTITVTKAADERIELKCGDLITYRLTEDQAMTICAKIMKAAGKDTLFRVVEDAETPKNLLGWPDGDHTV